MDGAAVSTGVRLKYQQALVEFCNAALERLRKNVV